MASVVTDVGTPCLVFDTLVRFGVELQMFLRMGGAGLAALTANASTVVLTRAVARFSLAVALPALTFGNRGNPGLSLCLFAFGGQSLALDTSYFWALMVVQFTVGVAIASGLVSVKDLLRVPALYAVLASSLAAFA